MKDRVNASHRVGESEREGDNTWMSLISIHSLTRPFQELAESFGAIEIIAHPGVVSFTL